jgi:hypothetical protein
MNITLHADNIAEAFLSGKAAGRQQVMDLYYYLLAILAKGMDFNRDVTPASMAGRGERDHVALAEVLKKTDCTLEQLTLSEDTLSAVLRLYLQAASAKMINLRHGVRRAVHQPGHQCFCSSDVALANCWGDGRRGGLLAGSRRTLRSIGSSGYHVKVSPRQF